MEPLVTADQFASFVKQDPDEWAQGRAQLCLDGACGAVVEYCGWHIAPEVTETVTVDGSGTRVQPLPTLNLTALNAISERLLVIDPDYVEWSANGILAKCSGRDWTRRRRGVVADITHGFAATPAWVVTLVCAVAARALLTTPGVMQEAAGGESVTYATSRADTMPGTITLMAVEKKMLDRIRLPLAG